MLSTPASRCLPPCSVFPGIPLSLLLHLSLWTSVNSCACRHADLGSWHDGSRHGNVTWSDWQAGLEAATRAAAPLLQGSMQLLQQVGLASASPYLLLQTLFFT